MYECLEPFSTTEKEATYKTYIRFNLTQRKHQNVNWLNFIDRFKIFRYFSKLCFGKTERWAFFGNSWFYYTFASRTPSQLITKRSFNVSQENNNTRKGLACNTMLFICIGQTKAISRWDGHHYTKECIFCIVSSMQKY
jgi:hypothetical protein